MGIAQGAVLGEMRDALKGMVNPEALMSAALWTMTMYLLLWTVPHPEMYHQIVYKATRDATAGCRTIADCRKLLTAALDKLAKQIATPGTELNQLVTRGVPRP